MHPADIVHQIPFQRGYPTPTPLPKSITRKVFWRLAILSNRSSPRGTRWVAKWQDQSWICLGTVSRKNHCVETQHGPPVAIPKDTSVVTVNHSTFIYVCHLAFHDHQQKYRCDSSRGTSNLGSFDGHWPLFAIAIVKFPEDQLGDLGPSPPRRCSRLPEQRPCSCTWLHALGGLNISNSS